MDKEKADRVEQKTAELLGQTGEPNGVPQDQPKEALTFDVNGEQLTLEQIEERVKTSKELDEQRQNLNRDYTQMSQDLAEKARRVPDFESAQTSRRGLTKDDIEDLGQVMKAALREDESIDPNAPVSYGQLDAVMNRKLSALQEQNKKLQRALTQQDIDTRIDRAIRNQGLGNATHEHVSLLAMAQLLKNPNQMPDFEALARYSHEENTPRNIDSFPDEEVFESVRKRAAAKTKKREDKTPKIQQETGGQAPALERKPLNQKERKALLKQKAQEMGLR